MSVINKATAVRLASFIERVERLSEDRTLIDADIREVFKEAKADGFDVAAMKKVIALRRKDPDRLKEEAAVEDTYIAALGALSGSPLGEWARDHMKSESAARLTASLETHNLKVANLSEALA